MTSPIVLRIYPGPGCLSAWHLGLLACGDAQPDVNTRKHLASCARCSQLLSGQMSEVAGNANAEIPDHVFTRILTTPAAAPAPIMRLEPRRTGSLAKAGGALAVLAACALVALQLRPVAEPQAEDLAKGGVTLSATVLRGDKFIANDVPMHHVPALQAGDRLRLHITGAPTGAQVLLQGDSAGQWATLYDATLPKDHWLPIGIKADGQSTKLKLRVCTDKQACDEHTFEL